MRILTARQMREVDRRAIDAGVASIALMERAGREVVAAMASAFPDLETQLVSIVCGRGNNGGDGFVVARLLGERGTRVRVVLIGRADGLTPDARTNFDRLRAVGVEVAEAADEAAWGRVRESVCGADLVVDALAGTGVVPPLTGPTAAVVRDLNASGRPIVAIDLPSGLSADRSDLEGDAIQAVLTVTLAAPKISLMEPRGASRAGRVVVADIGIPSSIVDALEGPNVELLTQAFVRARLTPRPRDAHKGDFGHVLVVGGSRGKTGAPSLSAMAALRSGAGLATVATPASCQPVVAALGREYMTLALEERAGALAAPKAATQILGFGADVIAIGPGLGRGADARSLTRRLVERCGCPLVLDADAIHAFAGDVASLARRSRGPIVLTPHPGEMAALTGVDVRQIQARRLDAARDVAVAGRVVVVLKGHHTVIATPDGRAFVNPTGNPGMATAGTGDVLTGAIAAWTAQLPTVGEACAVAVYLHGLAGDLAAAEEGEVGLVAGDLLARLGRAALQVSASPATPFQP